MEEHKSYDAVPIQEENTESVISLNIATLSQDWNEYINLQYALWDEFVINNTEYEPLYDMKCMTTAVQESDSNVISVLVTVKTKIINQNTT